MSRLNENLNRLNDTPEETGDRKIFIGIIAFAVIAFIVLICLAISGINTDKPIIEDPDVTIREEYQERDGLFVARSSWNDGSWCLANKEDVTAIHFVQEYDAGATRAWALDGVIFYLTEENVIYANVGNGVNMLGTMRGAFANFPNATVIDGLELLKTGRVTDMSYLFAGSGFIEIDITSWNTENVVTFSHMIADTTKTKTVKMSGLNMSNALDMSYMFANGNGIEDIYFENVDTSTAKLMSYFFSKTGEGSDRGLTYFHGDLETSQITDFEGFFYDSYLTNIQEITNTLETGSAVNMKKMYAEANNMWEFDASHLDTKNVKYMDEMFAKAHTLLTLDMTGWDVSSLETTNDMFYECHNIRKFTGWTGVSKLREANRMFSSCYALEEADIRFLDGVTLDTADEMFFCCEDIYALYSNGFSVDNPSNSMFQYCFSLPNYTEENFSSDMLNTIDGYLTAK